MIDIRLHMKNANFFVYSTATRNSIRNVCLHVLAHENSMESHGLAKFVFFFFFPSLFLSLLIVMTDDSAMTVAALVSVEAARSNVKSILHFRISIGCTFTLQFLSMLHNRFV